MKPARILIAAGLALAAFAALSIGPASAGKGKDSNVNISEKKITPTQLTAIVKSKRQVCEVKRKVVFKYKPPTFRADSAQSVQKIKLGTAKTNKKGKAKLSGNFSIGTYFVTLKPKKLKNRGLLTARKEEELEEEEADDDAEDEANIANTHRSCDGDDTRTDE